DRVRLLGRDDRAVEAELVRALDRRLALVLLGVDVDPQVEPVDAVAPGADERRRGLRAIDGDFRDVEPDFAAVSVPLAVANDDGGTRGVEAGDGGLRVPGTAVRLRIHHPADPPPHRPPPTAHN